MAWVLSLGACGDDPQDAPGPGPSGPPGELSFDRPGPYPPDEAGRLAPSIILLRTETGLQGEVTVEPGASFTWLELKDGDRLLGHVKLGSDAPAAIRFDLPSDFAGRLVARVEYANGEIWRRESVVP